MPRKKIEKKEFTPSKYQKEIFNFIQHGVGNAVIEAAAGSGKSTTIINCLDLVDSEAKVLLSAFNTDIVTELKKKVKDKPNVDARTLHSLGLKILLTNFHNKINPKPNGFKYNSYVYNYVAASTNPTYNQLTNKQKPEYIDNILKFVDFGRYYICETVKDLDFIESRYNIQTISNEKEVAIEVMEWGKNNISTIDFTDMIWLPIALDCKPYGAIYDWIFIDECQDLQKCERELLLRCTKMSTRMCFFGEKIQAINSFMGSDFASFDELRSLPNTISLPLSISYRCAKNIVTFANKYNPTMEASSTAPDGVVEYNVELDQVSDGDMILCRNNAPLLQIYCDLMRLGKKCYIRGKDVGSSLVKVVEKAKERELNISMREKGLFSKLYDNLFDTIDTVMRKNKISFEMAIDDPNVSQKIDAIEALKSISDNIRTSSELIEKLTSIFSDKKSGGISLSSIHKAKGLEADNVYIACPSLMPSRRAVEDWEKQQETNLEYVAYTRAKIKLGFLNEDKFKGFSKTANQLYLDLMGIKSDIDSLYQRKSRCEAIKPTISAAKEIIKKSITIDTSSINKEKTLKDAARKISPSLTLAKPKVKRKSK